MYRAYLEQSQVFVGIYWQRYGWVAPGMEISGLEVEYRLAAGKPMLLYVKGPAPDQEPRLMAMIERIRAAGTVSCRTFATPKKLEPKALADDLAVLLSESFAAAAVGTEASPAGLGEPAGVGLPSRDGDVLADRYRGVDAAVGNGAGGDGGGAGAAQPGFSPR
jgi:hypothetical protein